MKKKACHCCSGSGKELDHSAVGNGLRSLREKSGLSQGAVGRKMGKFQKMYISDLERGFRKWTAGKIAAYKKALLP